MRLVIVCCAFVGLVDSALAADAPYFPNLDLPPPTLNQPVLRGSDVYVPGTPVASRWAGFYFGGQVGYGIANMDFTNASYSLLNFATQQTLINSFVQPQTWIVLGKADPASTSFGGFAGYNLQWEDAVFGGELNYSQSSFFASSPSFPMSRAISAGGNDYVATVNAAASLGITDYGTVRFRGGYAMGSVMPYLAAGLALGRADVSRSAVVFGTENGNFFSLSQNETRNQFIYGYAVAIGLEYAFTQNLFARAEYEFIQFAPIADIMAQISTVRVGAGLKF